MTGQPIGLEPVSTDFSLDETLVRERRRVEEALVRGVRSVEDLVGPSLVPVVEAGVLSGGKRIRPILCVAAYRAAGGEEAEEIYDLASSVELIHAYSLMHDDLPCMDDGALRRGQPTPHRIYGEAATARAAAALIPAAAHRAWTGARSLGLSKSRARAVVRELTRAAGGAGMVGGQALDLDAEGRKLEEEALDRLHRLKTGALLAASPCIGGIAARAEDEVLEGLRSYGRALGLAFQIADDILDATASPGELGKEPSDRALEKSTYVELHGLEPARRRARAEVASARRALEAVGIASPLLHALAEYVIGRRR